MRKVVKRKVNWRKVEQTVIKQSAPIFKAIAPHMKKHNIGAKELGIAVGILIGICLLYALA
jgi:hypothetical protein